MLKLKTDLSLAGEGCDSCPWLLGTARVQTSNWTEIKAWAIWLEEGRMLIPGSTSQKPPLQFPLSSARTSASPIQKSVPLPPCLLLCPPTKITAVVESENQPRILLSQFCTFELLQTFLWKTETLSETTCIKKSCMKATFFFILEQIIHFKGWHTVKETHLN